jgi:hypothetical protein
MFFDTRENKGESKSYTDLIDIEGHRVAAGKPYLITG